MRTQHTVRQVRRSRLTRGAAAAVPMTALLLLGACGTAEPEVTPPATSAPEATPTDAAPSTTTPEETSETTTTESTETTTTAEDTATESTESTEEATSTEPPEEGAGDPATAGLEFSQEYAGHVQEGAIDQAYGMLSPEAMVYFPDQVIFEENGVAGLGEDLSDASGEPQWAIRPAYSETHDSAQVVSVWGEGGDGEPFAYSWAVRKLDGASWVIDQDISPSTGSERLNWLNPGIQEGVDPWVISSERPIQFALLKKSGPNVAVVASIDDGDDQSQQLAEMPTDGSVVYELSDDELSDGLHVVTASWVAEDEPFVHTRATPAMNP